MREGHWKSKENLKKTSYNTHPAYNTDSRRRRGVCHNDRLSWRYLDSWRLLHGVRMVEWSLRRGVVWGSRGGGCSSRIMGTKDNLWWSVVCCIIHDVLWSVVIRRRGTFRCPIKGRWGARWHRMHDHVIRGVRWRLCRVAEVPWGCHVTGFDRVFDCEENQNSDFIT